MKRSPFWARHRERMAVVYCPRTHDWFAHGAYPLEKMLAAGATVALGTDGRGSSPDLSLLAEMRFAARRHPAVGLDKILRMGTIDGARALGRGREIGSLEPGKQADLAIVALPDRDAADPHELLFDSAEPVWPAIAAASKFRSTIRAAVTFDPSLSRCPRTSYTTAGFSPVRRPRASRPWAWNWPGGSTPRSSRWIRWPCIAAWTSARRNRPPQQRRDVPHHLIDVLDPHEEFSLAQYIDAAERAAAEIAGRGRQALFVGGTPLYLKGLLRGIFEGPPADWHLRRRLADEAANHGGDWLHRRLAAVDPAAAARLHPNDARRLIRAIEVYEKTGQPISQLQQQFEIGRPAAECRVFVLDWPRAELHARIERRVREMFAAGLVEEVRRLCRRSPLPPSARGERITAGRIQPHRPPSRRLPRGDRASRRPPQLAETVELVERHTRQLAKRQMTWFRSLSECRFIAVSGQLEAEKITERIASPAERR